MSDESEEAKQNFLRENILNKGYDAGKFVDFLIGKKGEDGADVGNWSMRDLQIVVNEFITMQNNVYNPLQMQPFLMNNMNNNQMQNTVKNDPLANPVQPEQKKINKNDPLQSNQPQKKKKSKKYDPLSGHNPPQEKEVPKNNNINTTYTTNQNPLQNNNIMPQIQPQTQNNSLPQMQNQFNQMYLNQMNNFPNLMQQNQFNSQFQSQMMQGQFPQLIQQQNNLSQTNNLSQQNNNTINQVKIQEVNPQISPQNQLPVNEPIKQNTESQINSPTQNTDSQNKNIPTTKSETNKTGSKEGQAILYGIVYKPIENCKTIDFTPLSNSENPNIQVGFPEKVEGGFFSKSYVTYLVTTIPLNIKVRRRYSDFEWLRQILSNFYSGCVIPNTPRKNKIGSDKFADSFLQKRMRTLEKFVNYLLMNPIIKHSKIFYDFISIENESDFNKKKKEYEKTKPPQNISDFQSFSGRINIDVKNEKEIFFENIKDNLIYNEAMLSKLNENIKILKTQIDNVISKIDEIAQNWSDLFKTSTKYYDGDDISQTYENMSKLFTNWSDSLRRHSQVLNVDIREYFKYVKNHFKSMKDLISIVDSNKNSYYKSERSLMNKKEELFRRGDINKWELDPQEKDKATVYLQDKASALMKILPKETNNVINIKKQYGYYLNRIIEEYERIKIINSVLHRKTIVVSCDKLTEIYGDFQKGSLDIINFFVSKDRNIKNIINVNL